MMLLLSVNLAAENRIFSSDYDNPILFNDEIFGKYGNAWKPKKNVIKIKLSKVITTPMACYIKDINNNIEYLDFVRYDKGGRATYITNFNCQNYQEVKIVCEEEKQEVVFRAKGRKRLNPCNVIR